MCLDAFAFGVRSSAICIAASVCVCLWLKRPVTLNIGDSGSDNGIL